jgi:enterochelin esterase family protein
VEYVEVVGGQHNEETWAKVMPDFLRWAFRH